MVGEVDLLVEDLTTEEKENEEEINMRSKLMLKLSLQSNFWKNTL